MKLRSFAAAVFAGAALSAATVTDETPRHSPQPGVYRIMFTGNSITMHGFNEGTIRDLGWDRQCGMAASKLENDYVTSSPPVSPKPGPESGLKSATTAATPAKPRRDGQKRTAKRPPCSRIW